MNATMLGAALAIAILALPVLSAAEPLVFDDGGEHVIDDVIPNESIVIDGGSRVTILGGGVTPTIELRGGELILDGGSIASLIQEGFEAADTRFVLLAGEVQGNILKESGTAEILGGRIVGELRIRFDGVRVAGDAEIGTLRSGTNGSAGLIRIEGGHIETMLFGLDSFADIEFVGGTIESLRISPDDGGTFEMTGGTLCCGLASVPIGSIFAGSIGALVETEMLDIHGGVFTAGMSAFSRFFFEPHTSLFGGTISGPDFALQAFDTAVFDIHGGLFDGAFIGHDDSVFNIFGRDLAFDGFALRGFLEDGSSIDVPVQLFGRAAVRLVTVPETGATALLLLGLVGLATTRRRFES